MISGVKSDEAKKQSGVKIKSQIDSAIRMPTKAAKKGRRAAAMFDKNKCWDIFQDAKTDNIRLYQKKTIQKKIEFKFNLFRLQEIYLKLKLLISLKTMTGELYLLVALRCIRVARDIFLLRVEEGVEVFIPKELS